MRIKITLISFLLIATFITMSFPRISYAQPPFIPRLDVTNIISNVRPPADRIPPVPISDAALRDKEVGITLFGITIPGLSLDKIVIMVARAIISDITDGVVKWINEGDDGKPAFIQDPESFFLNVGNTVASEYLLEVDRINSGRVCNIFTRDITNAITVKYYNPRSNDPYFGRCDFRGITNDLRGFLDGDFSKGGWEGWFSLTTTPSNNPLGAVVEVEAELDKRIANAITSETKRSAWSRGILETSECELYDSNGNCAKRGPARTPGFIIEGQLTKVFGTSITELELVDEFDELVGALVGRIGDILGERIFSKNRGLIDSVPSNRGPVNRGPTQGRVSVSCYPDVREVAVGETVTWTARVAAASAIPPIYFWEGSEGLSGTTESVSIIYQDAKQPKEAHVTVTVGSEAPVRVTCADTVTVQLYPPIKGVCYPVDFTDGSTRIYIIDPWLRMRWRVDATGGSGTYTKFVWSGSNETVRTGDGRGNKDPIQWPYWWQGNRPFVLGLLSFFPMSQPNSLTQPATSTVDRWYDVAGTQTATVLIIDAEPTQKPATIQCPSDNNSFTVLPGR
jgi:hypothetical protein